MKKIFDDRCLPCEWFLQHDNEFGSHGEDCGPIQVGNIKGQQELVLFDARPTSEM